MLLHKQRQSFTKCHSFTPIILCIILGQNSLTILRHWGILWSQGKKSVKKICGKSKKLFRLYSKTILQLEYITLQPFLSIEKTKEAKMRTKNQDSAAGRFRARVRRQEQIFGLCDKDIAKVLGISPYTLYTYLCRPSGLSIKRLGKIAEILKLKDDEILEVIKGE